MTRRIDRADGRRYRQGDGEFEGDRDGFTDTDGSPTYQHPLSLRRAQAVQAALVASGVSPAAITSDGKGEEGLLDRDPRIKPKMESNRRVQVVVQ